MSSKKKLFSNFVSLSVLQGANYILPLLTLPYLARVLGPDKFGLIMFVNAFTQYFNILTDYGFNLSATREISIHRDNKEKISAIFCTVITIKLMLSLCSLIILTAIVFSFQKFRQDLVIYYLAFGLVLGQAIFPIWFFQGMEKMKYIAFLNIMAKSIFTVCIFVFINTSTDYIYVPLLNSLGFIVAGTLSLYIIYKDFDIHIQCPSIQQIRYQLIEGWHIFISKIAISLYTVSNTFILGIFTNNTITGYYSASEKLIKAVGGLLTPVSQTVYPHINSLASKSKNQAIHFIKKLTLYIGGATLTLSFLTFILSEKIVAIVFGEQFIPDSVIILKILCLLPFLIGLSNIFGVQTMLSFNYKKEFSNILMLTSIIHILLILFLAPAYKHIGVSCAVLMSEAFVTIVMFIFLQKKGIKLLGKYNV